MICHTLPMSRNILIMKANLVSQARENCDTILLQRYDMIKLSVIFIYDIKDTQSSNITSILKIISSMMHKIMNNYE